MYLKRLTCQGFKSFADKTDFDFKPGVTAIVGPNGCGKSNIVDAIKWVLGDQSARSLRGKQMMDVIFNGSGTRKTAGMAQVDLHFDNSDRKLASDADEVTVTRRLYRSGESEYKINNETRRLKDIRELFMDTGIGVGAYSIIEQGKVDILLQANPQERRIIFEEAAGISRYKARKKEAQRKLDRAEQNLMRVEDIIEEVQKRLRSIKLQAGKARNWQEYDRQLREKRATYSMAEYHRLTTKRSQLDHEVNRMNDRASELRSSISSAESRTSSLDNDLMQLEVVIDEIEQKILANAQEITANTERVENSRQRIDELTQARGRAQQRLAVERQRAAQLRRRIAEEEKAHQSLEDDIQQANATVEQLGQQDRELTRQFNELQTRSEDEKAGIIDLMRRTAQLHNEITSYNQRREQLENEQQRLHNRKQQIEEELSRLLQQREEIEQQGRELSEKKDNHNQQLEEKQQQAAELDASRAGINRELAAAKEYRSGLLSRKQLLNDLDKQFEGVDAGIREVLHQKEQNETGQAFNYVMGMVADLVAVDVSNATLIETALGEHDQYLVVNNSEAFFKDADTMAELPGKVRAVCLDRIPPFIDGRDFTNQEGFVAYAMDLVRYPDEAHRLVQHLLGKTVIVRNFNDALRMFDMNPPGYRYVTQSGELLDHNGMCQLGPASNGAGLISRKSELREIDEQIEEVDGRSAWANEPLQQTTTDIEQLEQEQQDLRHTIYEIRAAEADNNAARNNNEHAIGRLEQEKPIVDSELRSLDTQIEDTQQRKSQAEQTLAKLEEENQRREENVRQLQQQIDEVNTRRQQLADKLTEAKVAVGQLGQKRAMLADTLRGLRSSQQASDETVRSSAQEAEDAAHRMLQAERTVLTAESRLADLYMQKEKLNAALLEQQHKREHIRHEHEQIHASVKTYRSELTELEEKLHKMQMELQEVRIRIDDLSARIKEELDIDLAEAYAEYEHQEDQDWEALEAEINELKEKIRRLGNVNLDAIAEQEELEQRAEFLSSQHQDLQQSRKQLAELIDNLNRECRDRFTQTFESVREHFQELFRKLFGGGKGDVMLEQPADGQEMDVLEAGIDIQARPPGKELQNISLMSGGEKTMTAIALVLAIFRSRPSPFAILDEVDAALDESNNERFNHIIADFLEHSQFLLITHSKRTMSIADVMYGVTMQEAGVSKRVSVQFDSHDDQTAAA